MKFDTHKYWKHRDCVDVFFAVNHCSFDDDGRNALLHGTWCTQMMFGWGFTVRDRVVVKPVQYDKWEPYEPKGRVYL